uniref:Uncharacterized protein n=1 Tax=Leersia perrieri TaxID=77586 RepID=A0A0D9X7I1_9ORYZ
MVHDYVLRTASGSLTSREGDPADNDIEEADTGEYSPNFRHHRQGRRVAPPPPPRSPAAMAAGASTHPPPMSAAGAAGAPPPFSPPAAAAGEGREEPPPREIAGLAVGFELHQDESIGEPRRSGVHRRLEFGTPDGALQAIETLLSHPPVTPGEGSNAKHWFDNMAKLVNTAHRQLAADLASSSHHSRGSHATVSSSQQRRARRAAATARAGEVPTAAA